MTTQLQPLVESAGGSAGGAVPGGGAAASGAGFVQGIVTYTVMDDLKVSPMSSISGITLLNTFGVTDIASLQEKTVQLGYTEVTSRIPSIRSFDQTI
jgi:hydroxymethylpyrimidine/phosphomethylpyrimidine kinase